MFTLFLRKDIIRAQVLAEDLNRYRDQLHYTAALGREHYGGALGSPMGLVACFGAGCLLGLYSKHHPEGVKSLVSPLLSLTKSVAGH